MGWWANITAHFHIVVVDLSKKARQSNIPAKK